MTKNRIQAIIILAAIIGLMFACLFWEVLKDQPAPEKLLLESVMFFGFFILGNTLGGMFNWFGRRSATTMGLVLWLLGGAGFAVMGVLALSASTNPEKAEWTALFLVGYLFSNLVSGFSVNKQDKKFPPSPIPDGRAFLLGAGLGLGLLVLCSLFRLVDLVMTWTIWLAVILPASLYIFYNGKRMAEYAQKRQQAIEQNPQLIALFRQLGDGIEYDSVKCRASFASQASVEIFQQSATGWNVELRKER